MRLTEEVLFLRDQIRRIGKVMELVQAGKPFALIPHGPHRQPGIVTVRRDSARARRHSSAA
jgi:hypothetical protein